MDALNCPAFQPPPDACLSIHWTKGAGPARLAISRDAGLIAVSIHSLASAHPHRHAPLRADTSVLNFEELLLTVSHAIASRSIISTLQLRSLMLAFCVMLLLFATD
jgi:hypothetical protein